MEAQFNKAVACQKLLDIPGAMRAFQRVVAIGQAGDREVEEARDSVTVFVEHTFMKIQGDDPCHDRVRSPECSEKQTLGRIGLKPPPPGSLP